MRLALIGLRALFAFVGGLCLATAIVMFLMDCSGNQIRTVEYRFYYAWFLGFITGGIIGMIVAALLSDTLKKLPQDRSY